MFHANAVAGCCCCDPPPHIDGMVLCILYFLCPDSVLPVITVSSVLSNNSIDTQRATVNDRVTISFNTLTPPETARAVPNVYIRNGNSQINITSSVNPSSDGNNFTSYLDLPVGFGPDGFIQYSIYLFDLAGNPQSVVDATSSVYFGRLARSHGLPCLAWCTQYQLLICLMCCARVQTRLRRSYPPCTSLPQALTPNGPSLVTP